MCNLHKLCKLNVQAHRIVWTDYDILCIISIIWGLEDNMYENN